MLSNDLEMDRRCLEHGQGGLAGEPVAQNEMNELRICDCAGLTPLRLSIQLHIKIVALIISAALLAGCNRITSVDISGVYSRSGDGVVDTLTLATNGTFQQKITFTGGGVWTNNGSWTFSGQVVTFDQIYEAFEIKPDPSKVYAGPVIPPRPAADEVLWVEKGRLLKNSVEPIWLKQQTKSSIRFADQ